jgi:hypothetical protein
MPAQSLREYLNDIGFVSAKQIGSSWLDFRSRVIIMGKDAGFYMVIRKQVIPFALKI